MLSPGRYNTRDIQALYLSLEKHIAVGEKSRHVDQSQIRLRRDRFRLTSLAITLQLVLLCCELPSCTRSTIDRTRSELCRARRFEPARPTISQKFAAAAYALGAEGMLVPSCTLFAGGNLIVFPSRLRTGSFISVIDYEDPALFA
jgi:RES domain-containing protein